MQRITTDDWIMTQRVRCESWSMSRTSLNPFSVQQVLGSQSHRRKTLHLKLFLFKSPGPQTHLMERKQNATCGETCARDSDSWRRRPSNSSLNVYFLYCVWLCVVQPEVRSWFSPSLYICPRDGACVARASYPRASIRGK